MKPSSGKGTLLAQMLALGLLVLLTAEAVNLLIVLSLPPPAPAFYSQTELAQAIHGQRVRGNPLSIKVVAQPQRLPSERPGYERVRRIIAHDLGIDAARLAIFVPILSPDSDIISAVRSTFQVVHAGGIAQGQTPYENYLVAPFKLAVQRPDGLWIEMTPTRTRFLEPWQQRILAWFGLSTLLVAPICFLFARRFARPFSLFAAAAERLGRDPHSPPLEVRGSAEIRKATTAFNEMQDRLHRYVEDRTTMVGAIAHDLRTPLTRLRFRVEAAPDEVRAKMTADIDQMEAMIAATMAFVRDTSSEPQRTKLELSSLLESVTDDLAETGAKVSVEQVERVVINGDSLAIRRLLANLLENAVKFGGAARARLSVEDQSAVLEIDDDGPGVPDSELERVFAPFYRREPSRSRKTGGIGLGLSVARSIARSHGGDLILINRPGGGLTARASLPV